MCGIIGYIGNKQAQSILISGLEKLEYRGYDSCGVAIAADDIEVYKDAVRVKALGETSPVIKGTMGIGHTRWATHGGPSQITPTPTLIVSVTSL
jgi:glucosamine--fructose-6-phosphate aminotransferase (isomerizing)